MPAAALSRPDTDQGRSFAQLPASSCPVHDLARGLDTQYPWEPIDWISPDWPTGPAPLPTSRPFPELTPELTPFDPDGRPPISVKDVVDGYMDLYDKSGDGTIDIRFGQSWDQDERITGGVGNVHTMIHLLREADANGDKQVSRAELDAVVRSFDDAVIGGTEQRQDGMLTSSEYSRFLEHAIGQYSEGGRWDDRGVAQTKSINGERSRNTEFDRALPEYEPLTGVDRRVRR